ncbi:MAG: methionyl-tRNA formyltransferase [Clostridia bacterium]|nr:methionyl-tRNA formyltransferase [Clostridia bacterium]
MRIVFMGTPDFSATVLKKLCESGNTPTAVVTRADKPAGRGNELRPSPVKRYALEQGVEVLQPERLSDEGFLNRLCDLNPDIIIVVAYGRILPEAVLNLPRFGCINAHASLLPKYRGAAPMQRAIMNGEAETGVTIMKMDKGLDTGDMILTVKTPISDTDNLETVHDRLAQISGDALLSAMKLIESGKAVYLKQNDEEATYAEKILKNDEIIDLTNSAKAISNRIRALTPFPYAYCKYNGKMLKIIEARAEEADINGKKPGEILSVKNGEIKVATGEGILVVTKVFPESKRRMNALDFVNGSKIKPGDILE